MLDVWRSPAGVAMFVLVVTYNMSFVALLAMAPLFFQDYHGYSPAWTGVVFAVMLLGGGFTAPALGRLSDGLGRRPVTAAATAVAAVSAAAAAFAGNPVLLVLAVVVAASLLVGVRPPLLAAAIEMVGRRESTSLGLVYALMEGVGALGGLLAGLSGSNDLRYALVFAAVTAAVASVVAAALPFAVASQAGQAPTAPGATARDRVS